MPQFNIYPALQARGIDIDVPAVMRQAQGQNTVNALAQARLQEVQAMARGGRGSFLTLVAGGCIMGAIPTSFTMY